MTDAVVLNHVSKVFSSRDRDIVAIQDLSFSVKKGDYVCIVGRSGCGKSTSVNLILGLMTPSRGSVRVFGVDPEKHYENLRGRIACVFQSDRLLPWRNAIDNVRFPLEIIRRPETSLEVSPAEWLRRLGLGGFENAYPHELSGGMRQRVALARALACGPDVILADESFASLDAITGEVLRRRFRDLVKSNNKTVVHITHSIDEAIDLADRIIVVGKPGRVLGEFQGQRDTNRSIVEDLRLKNEILSIMADGEYVNADRQAAALATEEWR